MIPPDIRWDPSATPPQYTNNSDQVIEKGTQLRLKIMGVRSDVANMYAVGTIREDYLGYMLLPSFNEIKNTANSPSAFFEPWFDQHWTYAPVALVAARTVAGSRGADTTRGFCDATFTQHCPAVQEGKVREAWKTTCRGK